MPYIKVGQENSGPIELYYEDHGGPHAIAWTHAGQVNRALLDFLA